LTPNPYSKKDPYFAGMKDRYNLCSKDSNKETYHLILDISESGLVYTVGDCLGVCPENESSLVNALLLALQVPGNEKVTDKKTQEVLTFSEYLSRRANLATVTKKFFAKLVDWAEVKEPLIQKLEGDPELLRAYLGERDVLQLVLESGPLKIEPQEFVDLLMPLLPRFYSIASSLKAHPGEVHLTVARVTYQSFERSINGVCTYFLSEAVPFDHPVVPIFLHPHSGFTVPENPDIAMIMIGPGTGVAPFRAFMQEREMTGATGKNWLFYGDWFSDGTFLYREYWERLERRGTLKLDLAFSRDQAEKIYVQHKMLEKGKELYDWLEEGAILYVCGDAKKMARDVEATLLRIIAEHGGKTEEEAKEYVKRLRKEGRYLRDVY